MGEELKLDLQSIELIAAAVVRISADATAPASTRTWEDAVDRWRLQGRSRAAGTIRRERGILAWLQPRLARKALQAINLVVLDELRVAKLEEGVSDRSASYVVNVVMAILRAAASWGWIDRVPVPPAPKKDPPRVRWLRQAEAYRLLQELPLPLRDWAEFALETGLRQANLLGLRWDQVDLQQGIVSIEGRSMKARRPHCIPLTRRAVQILEAHVGEDPTWCFVLGGRRCKRIPHCTWYGALERASIEDFTWHDFRHTWASWHVQRGTPLLVLQQLGGWRSVSMVQRYAHLDVSTMRQSVAQFEALKPPDFAQIPPGMLSQQGDLFKTQIIYGSQISAREPLDVC